MSTSVRSAGPLLVLLLFASPSFATVGIPSARPAFVQVPASQRLLDDPDPPAPATAAIPASTRIAAAPAAAVKAIVRATPPPAARPAIKPAALLPARNNSFTPVDTSPYFDIPVTYNTKVRWWINYFQTTGNKWFRLWLERSHAYLPTMQKVLAQSGLPQDLAYVAMIESGFSPHATSTAEAVGYWQFITPTASRYGLRMNWWLDERRDFSKSTTAAARYLGDLFHQFGSWYLTAAAYNMGEGRMQRLVTKYSTKNYWILSKRNDFPEETKEYIPKMLAAMLIAKAPKLYGFHELNPQEPYTYDYFQVPGGTDLYNLAQFLHIGSSQLTRLNPELVHGFVPANVRSHRIRIPKGMTGKLSEFIRAHL